MDKPIPFSFNGVFLKPPNFKALIFDMDGVLVDTEPLHIRSFQIYMDRLGLNYESEYIHSFIGYSIAHNIQRINEDFLVGKEVPVLAGERERDDIYISLLHESRLDPLTGVVDLMNFCRQLNLPTALASSSSQEQVQIILNNLKQNGFNLKEQFISVVNGDQVLSRKPAPDIYQKTIENLELDAADCWAIEDSEAGVSSAKSAGVNVIGLISPYTTSTHLKDADFIVNSINEAANHLKSLAS